MKGHIFHVVGPLVDDVSAFMRAACIAVAHSGARQTILAADVPSLRHNVTALRQFGNLIAATTSGSKTGQLFYLGRASIQALRGADFTSIHAHGVLPYLVATAVSRRLRLNIPIVYTPHGSRSLESKRGRAAMLVASLLSPSHQRNAIVTTSIEAQALGRWGSAELIENPVAQIYFETKRATNARPLILAGGQRDSSRSAFRFAQLAVLMSAEELQLSFRWVGNLDATSGPALTAASVKVLDPADDDDCSRELAKGWMFLLPTTTRGFPHFLARAMALGLPCVAFDCPQHRDFIQHGSTGLLCRTEAEMLKSIAMLIDDQALREKIGDAARLAAHKRFGEDAFKARMIMAYEASATPKKGRSSIAPMN